MKRKNIFRILFLTLVMAFLPKTVLAANCDLAYHAQTGNYNIPGGSTCTITEDITIDQPFMITEGNVHIGLEHNVISTSSSGVFQVSGDANLTISGDGIAAVQNENGTVVNFLSSGSLTIKGGTLSGGATAISINRYDSNASAASLLIENGIISAGDSAIRIFDANDITIENGTFTANGNALSIIGSANSLTINGGTFNGITYSGAMIHSINDLKINGGTFKGGKFGVYLSFIGNQASNPKAKLESDGVLLGGTFQGRNDSSHAIGYYTIVEDNDIFNTLVGKTHHYSKKFKAALSNENFGIGSSAGADSTIAATSDDNTSYLYVTETSEVSIDDGAPTDDQKIDPVVIEKEEKTENPKTGSMLYIYILAFILVSGTALTVTYKYHKKLNK